MDEDVVSVTVSEMRAALALLLDAISDRLGETIDLGGDRYWLLELDQSHQADSVPSVVNAGSIREDVATVRELLADSESDEIVVWHDLSHIIGVLGRIAKSRSHKLHRYLTRDPAPEHRSRGHHGMSVTVHTPRHGGTDVGLLS